MNLRHTLSIIQVAAILAGRFLGMTLFLLCLGTLTTAAQDHSVRIAFMGNSIAYGGLVTNPATQSYPAQVGDLLETYYGDTCVIGNFSVSGRTLLKHGDFPLWNEAAFINALAFKPHIVVIALGTNDSKPQNWDEFGDEFHDDYLSMIDTFRRVNPYADFFVTLPPPAFSSAWNIRDSVIVNGVIPVAEQVAAETGAWIIDFYSPLEDSAYLFPDGIHPAYDGSAVMAGIVVDRFLETDAIGQTEQGLTFIMRLEGDKRYITRKDSAGSLTWTTINATNVYLDGSEVQINGSVTVDHRAGTSHILVATGEKNSDTARYDFILYDPVISKIRLSASEASMDTYDTVQITATYSDQYTYPLPDTVVDLEWSVSRGDGTFLGAQDNSVLFTSTVAGLTGIDAKYEEVTGRVWMQVRDRDHTFMEDRAPGHGIEVFPNPFSDRLTFRFSEPVAGDGSVKIIDSAGRTCLHREIKKGETGPCSLDTGHLDEGLYLLEVQTGTGMYSIKLIRQKACF
jgi:acyl-CoA thioesterase-1